MKRMKLAQLTSTTGALVLGLGLGAAFHNWFDGFVTVIAVLGLTLHAFGMWDTHRLEARSETGTDRWVAVLYWICWPALALFLVGLAFRS